MLQAMAPPFTEPSPQPHPHKEHCHQQYRNLKLIPDFWNPEQVDQYGDAKPHWQEKGVGTELDGK